MRRPVHNSTEGFVSKLSALGLAACLFAACNDETPFEPLSGLPFAYATPSCGPTDAPSVLLYLAAQSFELPQPVAPFIQIHIPKGDPLTAGDVFQIGEDFITEANAWFHGSGVETRQARGGEIGVTAFNANTLSGYVDLEFENGPTFRGTFIAAWHPRQTFCG
jgi:hypothetical protein